MSFWKLAEVAYLREVASEMSLQASVEWAWLKGRKFDQNHTIIINDVTFQILEDRG